MAVEEASSSSSWSWDQEKAFENALVVHIEDSSDRWRKIAEEVEGKSLEEVKQHYDILVEDINDIESGRVPLPSYASSLERVGEESSSGSKKAGHGDSSRGGKLSRAEQERRKGIAWTEEEHRLFLLGLDKYGKGDWRSISRNYVISRTPTQVASHAQKYFIRLNSMNKDRRRSSIHDITTLGNNPSTETGPITGQANNSPMPVPASGGGKPAKSSPQPMPGPPGVFGTTIGQPVSSPVVGTPVRLPIHPGPHMAYGVRAPVGESVVTGSPVNLPPPVTYPMPHTSAHR